MISSAVPVVTEKNPPHTEVWLPNLLGKSQRKGMTIYFPCDQIITTNEKMLDSYGFETQREMFSSAGVFLVQKCCCFSVFFFFFSNFPVALILYLSIKKLIWHLFVKYISLLTSFQKPKDLQIYLIFMTRYHHKHATLPLFSVFIGSKRHQCCLTVWYGHHIDVVWYKVLILIRTVNQVLLAVWTCLMKLKWSF